MNKLKKCGYLADILLLLFTGVFYMTDNIVYARLSQMIWDRLPMKVNAMWKWLLVMAGYLLVFRAMAGLFLWLKHRVTKKISDQIKENVYKSYVESRESVYTKKSILSVINNDIPLLETEYYQAMITLIVSAMEVVLAFVVTFTQNVFYGSFCFLFMLIPVFLSRHRATCVEKLNQDLQDTKKGYMGLLSTTAKGKDTIRSYQMFDVFLGLHGGLATNLSRLNIRKKEQLSKNMIFNQNTNRCASGLAALVGFYLAGKGIMTLGWVVAFIQISSSMTYTLVDAIQEATKIHGAKKVKKDIFSSYPMKTRGDEDGENPETKPQTPEAMGVLCHIRQCSLGARTVLENVDFSLLPGEKLRIMGENGSGKTTLLKLLLGLNDRFDGNITWMTREGTAASPENVIAYIPQSPFLFNDTVKRNIILDQPEDDLRYGRIKKLCRIALDDHKVVSNVHQNVSGGEKQKIELARALYSGRPVLILDEPYSALDQKSLLDIERDILMDPKKTVITISHTGKNENDALYNRHLVLGKPEAMG